MTAGARDLDAGLTLPADITASDEYIDSDAVFAVKPSLFRHFTPRAADDPEWPDATQRPWYSLQSDFVLALGELDEPVDPGRTA